MAEDFIVGSGETFLRELKVIAASRPEAIVASTFALYCRRSFSPLADLLRALNELSDVSILVGYSEAEALSTYNAIAQRAPNINWSFCHGIHAKFFVAKAKLLYTGVMGSHNLSDTSFLDISLRIRGQNAQRLFREFNMLNKHSYSLEKIQPYIMQLKDSRAEVIENLEDATFCSPNSIA